MRRSFDADPYPLPHTHEELLISFGRKSPVNDYVLLAGEGNIPLAIKIANLLGKNSLGIQPQDIANPEARKEYIRQKKETDIDFPVTTWPDGESSVELHQNVRGLQTIIFDSYSPNPNSAIQHTVFMGSVAKLADSGRVSLATGYFPYARQDRKSKPRTGVHSADVANQFVNAGHITRLLSMDLHAEQTAAAVVQQGVPWDIVYASKVFVRALRHLKLRKPTPIAPDLGASKRTKRYKEMMEADNLGIIFKDRDLNTNAPDSYNMIGNVDDCEAILFDDEISTGSTMEGGGKLLKSNGAREIYAVAAHGKFAPDKNGKTLVDRVKSRESPIDYVITTDSILLPKKLQFQVAYVDRLENLQDALREKRAVVLSAAPIYAVAIMCWLTGESLSKWLINTQ